MFYLFYIIVFPLAYLPLWMLYVISDCLYPVVYHLVRYRRKVVRRNLQNSFPLKSDKDITVIEKKFYHYFCDLMVETLHLWRMSEREIRSRITMVDFDIVENYLRQGRSVMLATAHYGNWEWGSTVPAVMDKKFLFCNVYKRLSSKNFDNFMQTIRKRSGGVNVEMKTILRKIYELRAENKQAVFAMIADQRPARSHIRYRTKFLNQTTSVITGTEQLAKKFDYAVVFGHICRTKRGHYEFRMSLLHDQASTLPDYELSDIYLRKLEKTICEKPEFWLWTHNRWKF
ncbi:MAG: lysophospholipid acyltransferase family protein [Paludibacter sp.]|jgi:KDO2-lipid IV(A) lauroyltransferase|nr:lysophospholipid acyltransferase family protein [Paludibacter sp.]